MRSSGKRLKGLIPLFLCCLLISPVLAVSYVDLERTIVGESEGGDAGAWLNGWGQRVKLTIDHNDVDNPLSNFPLLVYLSSSSGINNTDVTFIFDELQNDGNRKKIAITTSDGETECYVEIEEWDDSNEEAWLWVKAPSLNNTADTDLYLYYDSSHAENTDHVDDTNVGVSFNVWDSNFKGVWHFSEDPSGGAPQMKDSTNDNNDGTSYGTMLTEDQVTGQIDGSLDFDGVNDYIGVSHDPDLIPSSALTVECWAKISDESTSRTFMNKVTVGSSGWMLYTSGNEEFSIFAYGLTPATSGASGALTIGVWYHLVGVFDGDYLRTYVNGTEVTSADVSGTITSNVNELYMTRYTLADNVWGGISEEFRVSVTGRTPTWIETSYESGRDDLEFFGDEETPTQYPANLIITDLESSYEAKLYNSTGSLITNATANAVGTANMTLPSGYRSSTFEATFRIYDENSTFLYSKWFEDVAGGDIYQIRTKSGGLAFGVIALCIGLLAFVIALSSRSKKR